jgi:peptidoglycan/xylan/chitin deacetylase (PgdA/CDA1 family)
LIERLKFVERATRDRLLEYLENRLGKPAEHRVMLDWDEVRLMHQSGIDFGSHGLSHEIMTEIGEDRLREELTRSKSIIEQKLGAPCLTLAYPNGNHDDLIKAMAKETGYRCAVAVDRGPVGQSSDLFALNRLNVHENATRGLGGGFSRAQFACRLNGI